MKILQRIWQAIRRSANVITLLIAVLALWQSCESNRIAREARATTEESISRENTPNVKLAYYLAKSPDLKTDYDKQRIDGLKLVVRPINTRFWRREVSHYAGDPEKWYLFILIVNRGPGTAENIVIRTTWVPKAAMQVPDGLMDMEAPLWDLDDREFYALLVDTLQSPDPIEPLRSWRLLSNIKIR